MTAFTAVAAAGKSSGCTRDPQSSGRAADLRVFEPQERFQPRVHEELVCLEVPVPDADGARGARHRVALLTFSERILRCLAIGDIETGADVAGETAVRSVSGNARVEEPSVHAVGSADPILHLEGLACIECRRVCLPASVHILRVDAFQPAVAEFLLEGPARELQPWAIDEVAQLVRTGPPDQDRSGIRHEAETLFALAQGPLDAPAACSLDEQRANEHALDQHEQTSDHDLRSIQIPDARLLIQDPAAHRQQALADAPALELTPVERGHGRRGFNRNVLRSGAIESLTRHLSEVYSYRACDEYHTAHNAGTDVRVRNAVDRHRRGRRYESRDLGRKQAPPRNLLRVLNVDNDAPWGNRRHGGDQARKRFLDDEGGRRRRDFSNRRLHQALLRGVGCLHHHERPLGRWVQCQRELESLAVYAADHDSSQSCTVMAAVRIHCLGSKEHDRCIGKQFSTIAEHEFQRDVSHCDHHVDSPVPILPVQVIAKRQ